MANRITTLRLALLFVLVGLVYYAPPAVQLVNVPLLVGIFAMDALDGYIARNRHEVSRVGAMYDIAADRVIENVLWIVVTHLGYVAVWVPIVFVTRGLLVDLVRNPQLQPGKSPFGLLRGPVQRWLVEGRFMRGAYGVAKAGAFAWILLIRPWPMLDSASWDRWSGQAQAVTAILVYVAVGLCLVRGIPVIADFLATNMRAGRVASQRLRRAGRAERSQTSAA